MTDVWRKLYKKELRKLYPSPSVISKIISRIMGWAGHVVRVGRRGTHMLLMVKPVVKRPLGRPRRRWVDNIKMDLGEAGCDGTDLNWSD
jgi:hypothetical protein